MPHHFWISVTNMERSARLYDAALAALGYVRVQSDTDFVGYGYPGGGEKCDTAD